MNELHLFAGAGGGILGGMLLGHRPVCAVEINPYCRRVLIQRQRDGVLPWFPVWDDIRTFDGRPWRGIADVVCGGFPCQDISAAGKGAGIDGERSGLWREMARVIGEVRPRYVFVENSPLLVGRGLAVVLGDLADLGFDARWGVVSAADAGAPHIRKRIWILADANDGRFRRRQQQPEGSEGEGYVADAKGNGWGKGSEDSDSRNTTSSRSTKGKLSRGCSGVASICDADSTGLEKRQGESSNDGTQQPTIERTDWWATEPGLGWLFPDGLGSGMGEALNELRNVWEGFGTETIQRAIGKPRRVPEEEVLQQALHGYWTTKAESNASGDLQTPAIAAESLLRDVRLLVAFMHPPYRQRLHEQLRVELEDALLFMSYIAASRTGRLGADEAKAAMSHMRKAIVQIGLMFNPLITLEEAWRSLDGQWQASLIVGRWRIEPPLPRTVDGMANRVQRLRAIGNGQVPAVAALAWKTLIQS